MHVTIEGVTLEPDALRPVLVDLLGARATSSEAEITYDLDRARLRVTAGGLNDGAGWRRVIVHGATPPEGRAKPLGRGLLPITVAAGETPGSRGSGALDHVALVVGSIEEALDEFQHLAPNPGAAGRWEFPELRSTSVPVTVGSCYLELNEPWDRESFFASPDPTDRAHIAFVCLRVPDLAAAARRLAALGVAAGGTSEVKAQRVGGADLASKIGSVLTLPRRATGGLRTMLIETNWPWNALSATPPHAS